MIGVTHGLNQYTRLPDQSPRLYIASLHHSAVAFGAKQDWLVSRQVRQDQWQNLSASQEDASCIGLRAPE